MKVPEDGDLEIELLKFLEWSTGVCLHATIEPPDKLVYFSKLLPIEFWFVLQSRGETQGPEGGPT